MKKIYLPVITVIVCLFCFLQSEAQRKLGKAIFSKQPPPVSPAINSFVGNTTADCDTLNVPVDTSWSATTYVVNQSGTEEDGYLNGTNSYDDKQKANLFNLSITTNMYITGALIAFGNVNAVSADTSKGVFIRIYADSTVADSTGTDSTNQPGALLGSVETTVAQLHADVLANAYTEVIFPAPVKLQANQKFFISVDFSNLSWPNDTLWVAGTEDGQTLPGLAWEQWSDSSWHSFSAPETYSANITLWIFPYVSTSATGCSSLPVKLLSFNA